MSRSRRDFLYSILGIGSLAAGYSVLEDKDEITGGAVTGGDWLVIDGPTELYSENEYLGITWNDGGILHLNDDASVKLLQK